MSDDDQQNEETVTDETQQPEADQTPEVQAETEQPKRRGRGKATVKVEQNREVGLGRMVRYATVSETVRPAVITRVHEDDVVDLTVFNSQGAQPVEQVNPGSEGDAGTWHWPEFN